MPEKPRRSISRATFRGWRRRPGTATRLIAGKGWGMGQLLGGGTNLHGIGAVALAERSGIDLFELDLARQHLALPGLLRGLVGVEFWHHLAGEQFEALADVLVGVLAGLVEQNDLVDVRGLEPPELAPQGLGGADQPAGARAGET